MNIMMPVNMEGKEKQGKGKTVDISQVLRNVTGAESRQEKKSVIQRVLEPKEVDDSEKDRKKAMEIARRIARGKSVTPQEKQFLMEFDPKLAQMAELAGKEYLRIREALSHASTREEQQGIIQQSYQMVMQVSKVNEQFGMLLGEAVKEAVQESQKKSLPRQEFFGDERQPAPVQGISEFQAAKEAVGLQKDDQQALMEQFFPEEWGSILDCRG